MMGSKRWKRSIRSRISKIPEEVYCEIAHKVGREAKKSII